MPASPRVTLDLDAIDLDGICDFYRALLGYRVVHTQNPGLVTEARTLASESVPALRLRFRNCNPRPPMGCAVGTIRLITFEVDDPERVAARIEKPDWISPPAPPPGQPSPPLILRDSSGYHVALVRRPEDSA